MQKGGVLNPASAARLVTRIRELGHNTFDQIKDKLGKMNLVDDLFRRALVKYKHDGEVLDFAIVGPAIRSAAIAYMTAEKRDLFEVFSNYDTEPPSYGFDDYIRELLNEANTLECTNKLTELDKPIAAEDVPGHADFIAKCAWRPYIMMGFLPEIKHAVQTKILELYGDAIKNDGTILHDVADVATELGYEQHLVDAFKRGLFNALVDIEAVPALGGKRKTYRKKSKARRRHTRKRQSKH